MENLYKIKIWDLLHKPWSKDEIVFEDKKTDKVPGLSSGVSWTLLLQSLNESFILAQLFDVECERTFECERCGSIFKEKVHTPFYEWKFMVAPQNSDFDPWQDFEISAKDETINIEDMLVESIVLEEPITKLCEKCRQEVEASSDSEEDEGELSTTIKL